MANQYSITTFGTPQKNINFHSVVIPKTKLNRKKSLSDELALIIHVKELAHRADSITTDTSLAASTSVIVTLLPQTQRKSVKLAGVSESYL